MINHVAIITFLYEPSIGGGAAVVPNTIAQQLALLNVKVAVITSSPDRYKHITTQKNVTVYGIPTHNIYPIRFKDTKSVIKKTIWQILDTWNIFNFHEVKALLSEIQPKLMHTHKLRGLSPSVWTAAHDLKIPIIHTCHDYEIISPQGTLNGKIGQMALNRSFLLRPYQAIRRHASNNVNYVTAPSKILLDTHLRLGFFPNAKKRIISNSHGYSKQQIETFSYESGRKKSDGKIHFLFIGRIHKEKGIEDLLLAYTEFFKLNSNITLEIVGDGPLFSYLQNNYANHPGIHFHGYLEGEAKEKVLTLCDVLIFPSRTREAQGISILEAFSHGLPVVATRTGGPEEIVVDGINGYLIDPSHPEQIREKLDLFVQNPDIIEKLRPGCLDTAKNYTKETIMARYNDLYKEVLCDAT